MKTGLVVSGGGVRGAYEVGVLSGMLNMLPSKLSNPFHVFSGTSIGAINACYLASRAHRPKYDIDFLEEQWRRIQLGEFLKLDAKRLFSPRNQRQSQWYGRSIISPLPVEDLVNRLIDFDQLQLNILQERIGGIILPALGIGDGRTAIFTQLNSACRFIPSRDPSRHMITTKISADHVLASSALPFLLPARLIEGQYYCDGGIRFNTPIAPAIRAGVEKLVVISTKHHEASSKSDHTSEYPGMTFLLGKILNAMLLDPVEYDLHILNRFNRLRRTIEENVSAEALEKIDRVLIESRGASYRHIDTLAFSPSCSISEMAAQFMQENFKHGKHRGLLYKLLRKLTFSQAGQDADVVSYLLFDGDFAKQVIDLGRMDAMNRQDEIHNFFRSD